MHRLLRGVVLGLLASTACGPNESVETPGAPESVDPASAVLPSDPGIRWIPFTFPARPDGQGWVERIPSSRVGDSFLLTVEPELRTPAEGPWRLTLGREGDSATVRIPGLVVDRATGRLTFLVRASVLTPGDYLLRLELEEGGVASVPSQSFRFRLE